MIKKAHAKSSSHVIDDQILRVGMEMQKRLEAERFTASKKIVSDLAFIKIAHDCDFQTHRIAKKAEMTYRAVQKRRKALGLPSGHAKRTDHSAPKD